MTDVLDVISQEAQLLKASREELRAQLLRANRIATKRWAGRRAQWRSLVADFTNLVDRSVEPVFDAALAVAEFAHDMRASYRRLFRRQH